VFRICLRAPRLTTNLLISDWGLGRERKTQNQKSRGLRGAERNTQKKKNATQKKDKSNVEKGIRGKGMEMGEGGGKKKKKKKKKGRRRAGRKRLREK